MNVLPHGAYADDRRRRGVFGRVGQQVSQHLDDAPPVGDHQGQVGLDVDGQVVPAPRADEGAPCPVHQRRHPCGFGSHRQRACLDARHVQQVGYQVEHVVGLAVDDPEELPDHRGVTIVGRTQHGCRRALDGGERHPQLVAHHRQELVPQPLQLLQVRHVLEGDDHRLQLAPIGADGRGVEQHGDAPAVGDADADLFGPHRLARAQRLRQGELLQRDLPPVGPPEGQRMKQLLRRLVGIQQTVD